EPATGQRASPAHGAAVGSLRSSATAAPLPLRVAPGAGRALRVLGHGDVVLAWRTPRGQRREVATSSAPVRSAAAQPGRTTGLPSPLPSVAIASSIWANENVRPSGVLK